MKRLGMNQIIVVEGRLVAFRGMTPEGACKGVTVFGHEEVLFRINPLLSVEAVSLTPDESALVYTAIPGPDTTMTIRAPASAGASVQTPGG